MTTKDGKRKDTGEESLSVAARGHGHCINTGNCGEPGCPWPKAKRRGLVRRVLDVLVGRGR